MDVFKQFLLSQLLELEETQVPLGKEFEKVLYDNLWDLMVKQQDVEHEVERTSSREE